MADAFFERISPRGRRAGGRARDRLVHRVVAELLAWPEPPAPAHAAETQPLPSALPAAIVAAGAAALERVPSTRHASYLLRLERAVALLALRYRAEPGGALTPRDVGLVLHAPALAEVGEHGSALSMDEGLALLRLGLREHDHAVVEPLVAAGLELQLAAELLRQKKLAGLRELADDVEAARAWARWVLDLAPRLRESGVELRLPASAFRGQARGAGRELALFAQAMLALPPEPAAPASLRLARLDAVLALVQGAPEQARTLRAELAGTAPGSGRRLFPAFASWLDDDVALDRFCHLAALAGDRPAIPRALRRDFDRVERLLRERAHLESLGSPTAAQRERRARVDERLASGAFPTPEWTRRRLRERLEPALGRALEVRLDAALRQALRGGFGIEPPALTGAWRDAIRFYLATTRNRELLATLLRHAAAQPGAPIVRGLPANRAWLARASRRFDVEAWRAPRRVSVELAGRPDTHAPQEDTREGLRMGIPFDTCLSLLGGENAASTVLNALDANKRVLYLRDPGGTIVARKLLALSSGDELLGYRLYFALAAEHRPAVEQAVSELCRAIAREAGIPLADAGSAGRIHPGFWYDDGAEPFGEGAAGDRAVAELCASLGRPVVSSPDLEREARLWLFRREGDADAVAAALGPGFSRPFEVEAEDWLVDRLGEPEALRRCARDVRLAPALLRRASRRGPAALLAALGRLDTVTGDAWSAAADLLAGVSDATGLLRRLVVVARRQCGRTADFDDHGMEHGTLWTVPSLAEHAPVAEILDAVERLEQVWQHVVREAPECADCVSGAMRRLAASCEVSYAREPDPTAIVRCLSEPGRSEAALRLALHVAAVFPLPRSARARGAPPWGLRAYEGVPEGCPAAVRALRALRERRPGLARSVDYAAALLRQGGERGELLRPGEPPHPEAAPFEAIADLALHLPALAARVLEPWSVEPTERPGPWELFHHRRHDTPWRRQVRQHGAGTREATRAWAALLGEREPDLALPPDPRRGVRWYPPLSAPDAERIAAAVRRQLDADAAVDLSRTHPLATDPAHVRRVLRRVDEASLEPGHRGLAEAVAALGALELPVRLRRAVTWQLLDRGAPGAVLAEVAAAWLPALGWGLPELTAELAVRLGELPEVRALVVETLGRLEPDVRRRWYERLRAAGGSDAGGGAAFLDAVAAAWRTDADARWTSLGPELTERLAAAALDAGPAHAVRLYEELASAVDASRLLDRMVARFGSAGLAPHLEAKPAGSPEVAARRTWLAAAIEAAPPKTTEERLDDVGPRARTQPGRRRGYPKTRRACRS